MKKNEEKTRRCENCPDCLYILEGDYVCDSDKFDEQVIVLTNFSCRTYDYLRCRKTTKENFND